LIESDPTTVQVYLHFLHTDPEIRGKLVQQEPALKILAKMICDRSTFFDQFVNVSVATFENEKKTGGSASQRAGLPLLMDIFAGFLETARQLQAQEMSWVGLKSMFWFGLVCNLFIVNKALKIV